MNPVFKKLNFKEEKRICVLNSPKEFVPAIKEMEPFCQIDQTLKNFEYEFIIDFVVSREGLAASAVRLKGHMSEDVKLWIAYPKKSSKKYSSDINRDSESWQSLGDLGFEGVRQVAIDDNWSALRFRNVKFIKTLNRKSLRAMSKEGKKRTNEG